MALTPTLTTASELRLPNLPIPCVPGPVGARLQSYWRNWHAMGAEQWVVNVLRDGYTIPSESLDDASITGRRARLADPGCVVPKATRRLRRTTGEDPSSEHRVLSSGYPPGS